MGSGVGVAVGTGVAVASGAGGVVDSGIGVTVVSVMAGLGVATGSEAEPQPPAGTVSSKKRTNGKRVFFFITVFSFDVFWGLICCPSVI